MKGGAKNLDDDSSSSSMSDSNSSESSTSSSELMRALSEITVSSTDHPRKPQQKHQFQKHNNNNHTKYHASKHEKNDEPAYGSSTSSVELKGYGFSETSSEMPTNEQSEKYFVGGNSTETPYNVNSSSIATSDINLISVDSVNGRRFINKD
jgi:hypothetical protein